MNETMRAELNGLGDRLASLGTERAWLESQLAAANATVASLREQLASKDKAVTSSPASRFSPTARRGREVEHKKLAADPSDPVKNAAILLKQLEGDLRILDAPNGQHAVIDALRAVASMKGGRYADLRAPLTQTQTAPARRPARRTSRSSARNSPSKVGVSPRLSLSARSARSTAQLPHW